MVNYSEAKIYKVLNSVDEEIYVGSTTQQLAQRMAKHRYDSKRGNTKFHQHINCIGINNFYIELICKYPCDNVEELNSKEGECIRKIGTLNKNVSGRNGKQYYEDKRSKILEQKHQYYEQNKYICTCICGSNVQKIKMTKHMRTRKHRLFIETLDANSTTETDTGSDTNESIE